MIIFPFEISFQTFIQALCAAEDETDIQAAKTAKAEQKEELAEFDESLPWDDSKINEAGDKLAKEDVSMVEVELAMLDKNVTLNYCLVLLVICCLLPSAIIS